MSDISLIFDRAIDDSIRTLKPLKKLESGVAKAADLIGQCLRAGNKLLVCGNGGSAADAAHFVTELVVRFAKDRSAHPAICLASDGGLLTAAANDYGFNEIFARQVAAFGLPGDVLICLTTSGRSKNVARALEEARARKLKRSRFSGVTADRLSAWPMLIFWRAAIQLRGFRKRTSFCSTFCARSSNRD